jgi:hypothetical protein
MGERAASRASVSFLFRNRGAAEASANSLFQPCSRYLGSPVKRKARNRDSTVSGLHQIAPQSARQSLRVERGDGPYRRMLRASMSGRFSLQTSVGEAKGSQRS